MNIIRNPARSRPLSANVRRLMTMARESPENPDVEKIERKITARDLLYCDMQGRIFMAAVDRDIEMSVFAPMYMDSQLAGVIDHSFSVTGGMETDDISTFLQVPLLLKSPETIVDVILWLEKTVSAKSEDESASMAVYNACIADSAEGSGNITENKTGDEDASRTIIDVESLIRKYEYAYWLGYIYRCECLLHDESSRMVFGAFSENFMHETYNELIESDPDAALTECAAEICRRIDMLLIGKLWHKDN